MLEQADREGFEHVVGWQSSGRSFKVHNPREFEATILPRFFSQHGIKYKSFQRQLNVYNFQKIQMGSSKGGMMHKSFIRGRPELLHTIVRKENEDSVNTLNHDRLHLRIQRTLSQLAELEASPIHSRKSSTSKDIDNQSLQVPMTPIPLYHNEQPASSSHPPERQYPNEGRDLHQKNRHRYQQQQDPVPYSERHEQRSRYSHHHDDLHHRYVHSIEPTHSCNPPESPNRYHESMQSQWHSITPPRRNDETSRDDYHNYDYEVDITQDPGLRHRSESWGNRLFEALFSDDEDDDSSHHGDVYSGGVGGVTSLSFDTVADVEHLLNTLSNEDVAAPGQVTNNNSLIDSLVEEEREDDNVEDNGQAERQEEPDDVANLDESSFPFKLHRMLENAERDQYSHIVSWVNDGHAFMVYDQGAFVKEVLPNYFDQSKYESFRRQLNFYGFTRISRGPDRGVISHPCLIAGEKELCRELKRR